MPSPTTTAKAPAQAAPPAPAQPEQPAAAPAQPKAALVQRPRTAKPAPAAQPAPAPAAPPPAAAQAQPAQPAAAEQPKAKARAPRARPDAPHNGRLCSEVNAIPQLRAVWNEYYVKGVAYDKIEGAEKFNLRFAKGMTAYRVCRKYEKLSGTKRPKGKAGCLGQKK